MKIVKTGRCSLAVTICVAAALAASEADGVAQPRAIRYLYSKPWIGSLYSADSGLPLAPFELRITEGD